MLLGPTSLGGCQAPATTAPATLLGHWQCDTATSVDLNRNGQPSGTPKMTLLNAVGLDVTPKRLCMTNVTPNDTSEWTYTRRQDTLFIQCVKWQNSPDSVLGPDTWHLAELTPATLVLERTFEEESEPHPFRIRWRYHR